MTHTSSLARIKVKVTPTLTSCSYYLIPLLPLLHLSLSRAVIFLFYLKATKDQALERHFNLLTGLWKAPPVRFGCCGTVNGVYLLNGKREPQHRSHLREKMAVDITAGTEHYPSVKENGDF